MQYAIIAFVLATVAQLVVAAVLHIWWRRALISTAEAVVEGTPTRLQFENSFRSCSERLSVVESALKSSTNAQLAVEVAALDAAVSKHIASCKKQFGALYAERAPKPEPPPETPEETRARLRHDMTLATRHAMNLNSGGMLE